jgi:hypothetical protein
MSFFYVQGATKADPIHMAVAMKAQVTCRGMALRISFSTPVGDVNGVEPVKFMAKNELWVV